MTRAFESRRVEVQGVTEMKAEVKADIRRLEEEVRRGGDVHVETRSKVEEASRKIDRMLDLKAKREGNGACLGEDGEATLYDRLSATLLARGRYAVRRTNKQARECDLSVTREGGYPEVRVELKTYDKQKSNAADVTKFKRDLAGLNMSGIFVSQNTGIIGRVNQETEELPNGKLAVYLCGGPEMGGAVPVETICAMLLLIYMYEEKTLALTLERETEDVGGRQFSAQEMADMDSVCRVVNAELGLAVSHAMGLVKMANTMLASLKGVLVGGVATMSKAVSGTGPCKASRPPVPAQTVEELLRSLDAEPEGHRAA